MTLKYSTAARNFMAGSGSFKQVFQNGRIEIYTGAQPATAEAAVTGTLLCTITNASGTHTREVCSFGTVTLTGGASGSVSSITVNSVEVLGATVAYNGSLTQTAADIAAQINAYQGYVRYRATSSGAVVTITAMPGLGTTPNTYVVATTAATITKTDADFSGGIAAVNGLKFGAPASTIISKLSSQTWSGVNAVSGAAGYYRMYSSVADTGALDTGLIYMREDGVISTSGAELNMSSTALTAAATTTISSWDRTLPTL